MANNREDMTLPPNVSKLIFAEDLIRYVIRRHFPYFTHMINAVSRYERFRHLIHNGFDEYVQTAIEIIREMQVGKYQKDYVNMRNTNRIHLDYFTEYVNNHRPSPFEDEFQAAHFLMYCARAAYMSGCFLFDGIDGAHDIAIDAIVRAFPEGDMSEESWNKLHSAAETYLRVELDFFKATTPSGSDIGSDYTDGSSGEDEEDNDANSGADGNLQAEYHL